MSSSGDLEERVAHLEELVNRAIARARETTVGRSILRMLGLE